MRKLLLLPLVALMLAADDPTTDKVIEDDLAVLQGVWTAEKAIMGGMEMPADMLAKVKLEFKGKQVIPHGNGAEDPGDFTLDPAKSPKQINIKPKKEKEVAGIYELKGNTLKFCFARPGLERPKEFKSPAGKEVVLIFLKREKK